MALAPGSQLCNVVFCILVHRRKSKTDSTCDQIKLAATLLSPIFLVTVVCLCASAVALGVTSEMCAATMAASSEAI